MQADAAVAVIILKESELERVLLLKRAQHPNDPWSGHYAFPGGRYEKKDKSLFDTCLRETYEECGLKLFEKDYVQKLPLAYAGKYVGKSVSVSPFLFEINKRPKLKLDFCEIASFHWMPLEYMEEQYIEFKEVEHGEKKSNIEGVSFEQTFLWGFTYKVLREFLENREF